MPATCSRSWRSVQAVLVGGDRALWWDSLVPEAGYGDPDPFLVAAGLYLVLGVAFGIQGPIRQAFLNRQIPSAQRATVLSLMRSSATVAPRWVSWGSGGSRKPFRFLWRGRFGGLVMLVAAPLYRASRTGEDGAVCRR